MKFSINAYRLISCIAIGLTAFAAQAQNFPIKPLKFIIPYPPAGIADQFARALADQLSEKLGQSVVPENKPGGSLIIGTDAAAKSPPDGYTMLLGSISSLAINVGAFKKLPYDPVNDFAPLSLGFYTPLLLVVNPNLPAKNVRDLITYAKANPKALSFASIGHGSSVHLAAEIFKSMAGIDLQHVPYKGTTVALPDIMSDRVNIMFDGGAFLPQVRAGKVRLLAVTSPTRLESLPDTPTLAEAGVPGYEVTIWFGMVAPAGTPRPIVDRLSREIVGIVRQPAFKAKFAEGGIVTTGSTPEEFAATIKKDIQKWPKVLRDAGVQPE
ncbi:MAG: Bug family tripartite tricarboxylate transporter substrate binding protein [Burkholderiales bacterium]